MDSNSAEKLSISSTISKKNLSKEARMILLMTKVRQAEQDFKQEQSTFINMMKEARKGIKEELKVLKQDIRVLNEEKSEPEPEPEPEPKLENDKSTDEVRVVVDDEVAKLEPEVINTENETKLRVEKAENPEKNIDPNIELLRNIKRRAAKKIDTGGGRGASQSTNDIKTKQQSSIRKVNDTPKNRKVVSLIGKTDKSKTT